MKKIGEYTARGIFMSGDTDQSHRIQLFDGRFDTGYRVTSFEISLSNRDSSSTVATSAKLMTEPDGTNRYWNYSKNTQIAWAQTYFDANGGNNQSATIDPDNLIVEDLYIGAVIYNDAELEVNYLITFDKYDISEWRGALAMVRNRSQA